MSPPEEPKPFLRDINAAAARVLKGEVLRPGMDVLDFACGQGLLALALADSVRSVVGVDASAEAIKAFQAAIDARPSDASSSSSSVRCACTTLTSPAALREAAEPGHSFPSQYDLVVSVMAFHHLPDIPATLQVLTSLLKPRGRLAVFDLARSDESHRFHRAGPEELAGVVFHHGGFTAAELGGYLSGAGLVDVSCREVHRFSKPDHQDTAQQLEFGLLLALGTKG